MANLKTPNETKSPKVQISFWHFLFKIGDDYLMFLRNLTPVILFLSLGLFTLPHINFLHWDVDEFFFALFSFCALFIALSVMLINLATFSKKMVKTLRQLQNEEWTEEQNFRDTMRDLWKETSAKQFIFFLMVTIVAVIMVTFYGMNYAFNFYRSISSLMGE